MPKQLDSNLNKCHFCFDISFYWKSFTCVRVCAPAHFWWSQHNIFKSTITYLALQKLPDFGNYKKCNLRPTHFFKDADNLNNTIFKCVPNFPLW